MTSDHQEEEAAEKRHKSEKEKTARRRGRK